MAPRRNTSGRRTPSSAPFLAPVKTSYRVKRRPASPLPNGDVLDSPRYSPSPSPRTANMPGSYPREPAKWLTKPLLPFRKVHQFRPYGKYMQFPGAGFLETRLRKMIEEEMVGVLRSRVEMLENENERLRRDWVIQVELQDRGHGELYTEEEDGRAKTRKFETLRVLAGARDRGAVMVEVYRLEHQFERALERAESWQKKSDKWKKRSKDVEGRYANVKKQMEALQGQLAALAGAEEEEEQEEDEDEDEDEEADDEEEQRELNTQFERDAAAVAAAQASATTNPGRGLRSQKRRG
ncbi:MAG: hypothetical protein Q9226_001149 [Calogaya cf. arnoldii]